MLYPKRINAKKGRKVFSYLLIASVLMAILLILINKVTRPDLHWAAIAIAGMIYIWIVVIYALCHHRNIASHVLLQVLVISIFLVYMDYLLGFKKWSLQLAIPIVIIAANVIMGILTITSYKKYIRYVVYELLLALFSLTPLLFISSHLVVNKTMGIIAVGISIANLILTILLCSKEMIEALKRTFHL